MRNALDFRRVRAARNISYFKSMVVYQSPGAGSRSRVGIAVGARLGNAVIRNRMKRRIRAASWHELAACDRSRDLVIVARRAALQSDFADLRRAIRHAITRGANE